MALLSLLLCAPAWAATALDVRMSILNDCVARALREAELLFQSIDFQPAPGQPRPHGWEYS